MKRLSFRVVITTLSYSNDIALVAKTPISLQNTLNEWNGVFRRAKIKTELDKTERKDIY